MYKNVYTHTTTEVMYINTCNTYKNYKNTCMDACNSALASGAGTALDSLEPLLVDSCSRPAFRLVVKWAKG